MKSPLSGVNSRQPLRAVHLRNIALIISIGYKEEKFKSFFENSLVGWFADSSLKKKPNPILKVRKLPKGGRFFEAIPIATNSFVDTERQF